jgi:hypothetical protein
VAAKVVTVFNAVKGFAQSLKNGNVLGMVGSAAGAALNFSQGAFHAFASKVANLANVGQQVVTTLAHGMGKGLLQVVSNGANLVSGIAQAAADLGQGGFQSGAHNVAQVANSVGGYTGGVDSALKGDLTPLLAHAGKDVVNQVVSNTPPQAQSPAATQPALNKGPKESDGKGPKDPNALGPDGKDVTGLFPGDDPKDPIYKNLNPDNGQGKDFTGLPGLVSDAEDLELGANPGDPASTPKPGEPMWQPGKDALIRDGIYKYSRRTVEASVRLMEIFGGGGVVVDSLEINTKNDGRITEEEAGRGLAIIEMHLANGRKGLEVLKTRDGSWKNALGENASYEQILAYYQHVAAAARIVYNNSRNIAELDGVPGTISDVDIWRLKREGLLAPDSQLPSTNPTRNIVSSLKQAGFPGVSRKMLMNTIRSMEALSGGGFLFTGKDNVVTPEELDKAYSNLERELNKGEEGLRNLRRMDSTWKTAIGPNATDEQLDRYYQRVLVVARLVLANYQDVAGMGGNRFRIDPDDVFELQKEGVLSP